jgi:hypothetical protein
VVGAIHLIAAVDQEQAGSGHGVRAREYIIGSVCGFV